jgi:hypothetical protein
MNVKTMAMVFGVVFLIVGAGGFIPGLTRMIEGDDPNLIIEGPGHGYLLGLFHVNVLHNLVHILFGVWGLVSAKTIPAAVTYFRGVGIAYILLAILGIIPMTLTQYTFGLVPIHGYDVWLHALLGVAGLVLGFMPTDRVATSPRM